MINQPSSWLALSLLVLTTAMVQEARAWSPILPAYPCATSTGTSWPWVWAADDLSGDEWRDRTGIERNSVNTNLYHHNQDTPRAIVGNSYSYASEFRVAKKDLETNFDYSTIGVLESLP